MGKREIDILDILPQEAIEEVDKLGYAFLAEQGFDTDGAAESASKRTKLKRELAKQGKNLFYRGAVDPETKAILVWYEIEVKGKCVAKSMGIKFLPKPKEEGGG